MNEKERVIKDMIRTIDHFYCGYDYCKTMKNCHQCDESTFAEDLYKAGYRKQSEVGKEIFNKIKDKLECCGYIEDIKIEDLYQKIFKEYGVEL